MSTIECRPSLSKRLILNAKSEITSQSPPRKKEKSDIKYLPENIASKYKSARGIKEFYPWQTDCLNHGSLLKKRNMILSLPTSAGKTLIAEMVMLKQILSSKDALFILPYVSIVQEKTASLVNLGLEMDFLVEEYAGNKGRIPPIKRRKKSSVYVATIEKAHSIIYSLMESDRIQSIGAVIVDELHMVGEEGRGGVLEQTLAMIMLSTEKCQIIGMSATIGNLDELCQFLDADLFTSDFRPVELEEMAVMGPNMYKLLYQNPQDPVFTLHHKQPQFPVSVDGDESLANLVQEVIPSSSVLVFCPTKVNAENVALSLIKMLPKELKKHKVREKYELVKNLMIEMGSEMGLCKTLRKCIPFGLAYHHSGLTAEERRLIQDGYMSGVLCAITCTSTLAAGVNLPARRVILRCPFVGNRFIRMAEYKQMIGRAGRAGLDTTGESVLLIHPTKRHQVWLVSLTVHRHARAMSGKLATFEEMVREGMGNCRSRLLDNEFQFLKSFILSLIILKVVNSEAELVEAVLRATLAALQTDGNSLREIIQESVKALTSLGLLRLNEKQSELGSAEGPELSVTNKGIAGSKGPISTHIIDKLNEDLMKRSQSGLITADYFHLIISVIPYDIDLSTVQIQWDVFYDKYLKLNPCQRKALELENIDEGYIAVQASSYKSQKTGKSNDVRSYLALIMYEIFQRHELWKVAEDWKLPRGWLQSLIQSTVSFASAVARFSEVGKSSIPLYHVSFCPSKSTDVFLIQEEKLPSLWSYSLLLPGFVTELSYCVIPELIPLMGINGVKKGRARQLYNAGYRTLLQVVQAKPDEMVSSVEHLSLKQARQIISSAKMIQQEEVAARLENLQEVIGDSSQLLKNIIDAC